MDRECKRYVNKFRDETLPHFVQGLAALLPFANSVATFGKKDLEESECDRVKREVEVIHQEISQAEHGARILIDSMSKDCEQLAKDIDDAQDNRKNLEESLQGRKNELVVLENQRYQINDKLQTSRCRLLHLESTLTTAEAKLAEKTTGRDMGIGLLLIAPCVGWDTEHRVEDSPLAPRDPLRAAEKGIPMTIDYNKELKNTRNLLKTTDEEKHHLSEAITQNEEEMKRFNSQIPEKKDEIEKLKDELARKERKVESLEIAFKALIDTKVDLKHCYNYLFSLLGTVEVLYKSCKDLYSLEPIMPAITETFKDIQKQNSNNELLTNHPRVKELFKSLWMQQCQVVPK